MIQRFIELGEGYSDLYELLDIARRAGERIDYFLAFHTQKNNRAVTSCALVLKPTKPGDFQPIYLCREGIPSPHTTPNERYRLFEEAAKKAGKTIVELELKPSSAFAEKDLYYQYVIGILRINHFLPPFQ